MQIKEIKKAVYIGAGTMGCYNSLLAGIAGYDTVVYDISQDALEGVPIGHQMLGDYLAAIGAYTPEQLAEGGKRIRFSSDLIGALENADIVSESVFENLELKRKIHRQLDEMCPPETILTTNTSSLMVSEIEDVVGRGERFAAMHYHLGTPLVDVVGGPRTTTETVDIITRFVESLQCIPFSPAKENRGYVFNNLIPGLNQAAVALVMEYGEFFEDVDRAWMSHENLGPFATMDLVGLNVYYDGSKDSLDYEERRQFAQMTINLLQPYIDRGELGIKTGKGFYSYPEPSYGKPEFLSASAPREDIDRVLTNGVIIRAILLAAEGIADCDHIDKIWMINMMSGSGPFAWLDKKGINEFLNELESEQRQLLFPEYDLLVIKRFLKPYLDSGWTGLTSGRGIYSYPEPEFEKPDFLENPFKRASK
ncbi:3-hydroxyacyl-CoA dehydrogenase (NAD-binding) [Desulfatibacillum aliphaticivorans]|uniref:3-hydroxyacyl-CoA dehydrogenase (NAD-binding) n=1 Tax=Desulfatibacillum aliphaticivorans TaxID=218208 RepID=B8F8T1_DESAL|nr:3-hydroxyacyl-CoA dehydrogenase NAD-binding domain-containing protein [Desulfatibacillum aliphaticivorans]ACL01963.1 3-hydroxyacyl-CoA dehydrogenase (NAD-binding) [Desulfatibacillum aliphaticivorans]